MLLRKDVVTNKLEFLAQLPVFEALNEGELWALAQICTEYEFEDGAVLAYQRDVADSMYIVRSGRLFARTVDERGIVRDTQSYLPGDCFGDQWMFAPDASPATVKASGVGQIIIIKGSDFLEFLGDHPQVLEKLEPEFDPTDGTEYGLSVEAWDEAQKMPLKADKRSAAISLLPDELVEFQARRSRWYLLLQTALPLMGLIFFPLVGFALLSSQPADSLMYSGRWLLPLLLALVFGVWLAFQALDWSNDYFVITNKHLAHREFSLRTFRTTVNKIPLDQIQSVEVERPSFIANLFDFGTARVTTAAQAGTLRFDNIDAPGQVEETLNRLRHRVMALDAGRAQATMRRSIESHFQVQPAYHEMERSHEDDEYMNHPDLEAETPGSFWKELLDRYRWRVEENGIITYRKHFFVLLREVAWPAGIAAGLVVLTILLLKLTTLAIGQLAGIVLLLALLDTGWLIWEIEDWRNDTFQLTDRYVIDIDRRPFGFGESRKQAELSNVQNVNSDRPNFIATVFNYGNVVIETAGATNDIIFENVSNPNRIQSDVFRYRDQNRRRQHMREGERRRKEYSVLLDVYQQATEQGRIPRRTPPSN
jgi:CRP-like cAMP-binding protein/uncharacterized membrane protein YdbT with pleckstrin-like domain